MPRHLPLIAVLAMAGCSAQPDASTEAAPSRAERPSADSPRSQPHPPGERPPHATEVAAPDGPAAPSNPPPATAGVPKRFQGTFALNEQACGQSGHESHLDLSADRIQLHESSGPIEHAQVADNTLHVVARMTGEGETREATYRFALTEDGRQLSDLNHGMVRVRCP